jgi:hypothetical protein
VLYDDEIDKWAAANVPGYRGSVDRTRFAAVYPTMAPGESIILNLDPKYKHGGTHWVALRASAYAPLVYYKDSYGAPPPTDVSGAVAGSGRGLVYGNRVTQKLREVNCGKRSAEFLRDMAAAGAREIAEFERLEMA